MIGIIAPGLAYSMATSPIIDATLEESGINEEIIMGESRKGLHCTLLGRYKFPRCL